MRIQMGIKVRQIGNGWVSSRIKLLHKTQITNTRNTKRSGNGKDRTVARIEIEDAAHSEEILSQGLIEITDEGSVCFFFFQRYSECCNKQYCSFIERAF